MLRLHGGIRRMCRQRPDATRGNLTSAHERTSYAVRVLRGALTTIDVIAVRLLLYDLETR